MRVDRAAHQPEARGATAVLFAGTRLMAARTRELVEKVIRVPALLVRRQGGLQLELPAVGVLARELREALSPTAVQLPLTYSVGRKGGGHALLDQYPQPR